MRSSADGAAVLAVSCGRRALLLAVALLPLVGGCEPDDAGTRRLEPMAFGDGTLVAEWQGDDTGTGAASVTVRIDDANGDRVVYSGRIDNGGEPISYDNLRPDTSLAPDTVFLCVNGIAQADVRVRIHAKSGTVVRFEQACAD